MSQSPRLRALQVVLTLIGLYHIGLGVLPFVSLRLVARIVALLFGMTLLMTPQLHYLSRVLGVYAFIFGVVALLAARRPVQYRALTHVVLVLYALRIVTWIAFLPQYTSAFETTSFRAWLDVVLLAAFGTAVALLRPKARPVS